MLNKAILCGRLTKTPEETATQSGTVVSRFSIAIDRRYQKQGEEKQTDFLNIVAFGKTAEFVGRYFTKGSPIIVVGSIQTRSYEKDGQKRYATEIIADEVSFAGSKKDNQGAEASADADPLDGLITAPDGFVTVEDDESLPF